MNGTETVIFILLLMVIGLSVAFIEEKRRNKKKIKSITTNNEEHLLKRPGLTYDEAKEILDTVVSDVLIDLNLRLEVNEVKYIKNVEKETVMATTEVLDLVSDNIIAQLKCYVDERFIVQYIARNVRGFLIGYLKEKNVG